MTKYHFTLLSYISIHALLAESDISVNEIPYQRKIFLSTLSLRRATSSKIISSSVIIYFYPRSPCGERLHAPNRHPCSHSISIHALLAESDPGKVKLIEPGLLFLSTLSLRRATCRAETSESRYRHFYPRSPCGERRLFFRRDAPKSGYFYPRSPCGERRAVNLHPKARKSISIHALLAESD